MLPVGVIFHCMDQDPVQSLPLFFGNFTEMIHNEPLTIEVVV